MAEKTSRLEFLETGDGSHTLYNPGLDETYHSRHGAIQESQHVFIKHGLEYFLQNSDAVECNILEVGFGTGLNVLLAAAHSDLNRVKINFESLEPFPIESDIIEKLNYLETLDEEEYLKLWKIIHNSEWDKAEVITENFTLTKWLKKLEDFKPDKLFQICFFDAFAPAKQPELWEKPVLEIVFEMLDNQGILVTYCAKGQFKRDLRAVGFEVETLKGPPGKAEMVRAVKV